MVAVNGHLLGYARVSTLDQNPQLQLDALEAAGCDRIWTDRVSGSKASRPQLDELLAYARPGDTIAVWRLDRLGRSLRHLLEVVEDLEEKGIGFRSITESIDTTTATGRLVFAVFAALAEFERDLLRERTMAGLAVARAKGRLGGRPPKMTPAKLAAAKTLIADGATQAAAAEAIDVSRTTLVRHLQESPMRPGQ